jgi:hypothetical protein
MRPSTDGDYSRPHAEPCGISDDFDCRSNDNGAECSCVARLARRASVEQLLLFLLMNAWCYWSIFAVDPASGPGRPLSSTGIWIYVGALSAYVLAGGVTTYLGLRSVSRAHRILQEAVKSHENDAVSNEGPKALDSKHQLSSSESSGALPKTVFSDLPTCSLGRVLEKTPGWLKATRLIDVGNRIFVLGLGTVVLIGAAGVGMAILADHRYTFLSPILLPGVVVWPLMLLISRSAVRTIALWGRHCVDPPCDAGLTG